MDVDAISVNTLSREERERHVQNNLCFICHKDGHMSKECPDRKHYKGGSSKGKYKESTRKESDLQKDAIFEPQKWMAVPKKKKKTSQSLANQMKRK